MLKKIIMKRKETESNRKHATNLEPVIEIYKSAALQVKFVSYTSVLNCSNICLTTLTLN